MLKKRFFKTKDEVEVTFEVQQENWESAHVVGEFNNWKPEPMTLVKKVAYLNSRRACRENKKWSSAISLIKTNGVTIRRLMAMLPTVLVVTMVLS